MEEIRHRNKFPDTEVSLEFDEHKRTDKRHFLMSQ